MWFDESVFYQIYPLGYCGAERKNDFFETRHRLKKIEDDIPRLKEYGVTAVLFNPLFESCTHGYDTADFFSIDRRLGSNEEFKALVKTFHDSGIKVVLDGVFNHVGREFAPFKEVLKNGEGSGYRFWFNINFSGNNNYGDGFSYDNWEGHNELVKLRLENPDVQNYLMDAVRFWIDEFNIDGLRLDVCYLLPPWFIEIIRRTAKEKKEDFFLLGEVIHIQNFAQHICPQRLDSITNYECFKGMVSSVNSDNLCEIEYSVNRLFGDFNWCLYTGKKLFNFVDNHDVLRVFTAVKDRRKIYSLYTVLFTIPGIPCIYYGSEYGAEGDKSDCDVHLRPCIDDVDKNKEPELYEYIKNLIRIRKGVPAISYGGYSKVYVDNRKWVFRRAYGAQTVFVAVNISDSPAQLYICGGEGTELLRGGTVSLENLTISPFGSAIILKNN